MIQCNQNDRKARFLRVAITVLVFIFFVLKGYLGRGIIAGIVFILIELLTIVFLVLTIRKEKKSGRVLMVISMLALATDIVLQILEIIPE